MDNLITGLYHRLVAISGRSEFIKAAFSRFRALVRLVSLFVVSEISKKISEINEKFYLEKYFEIFEYYFRLAFGSIFDGDSFERIIESFFQKRKNGFG